MAIIRVQAAEDLDWVEACDRASTLLDANSGKFKAAVKREAQRTYKRRFMTEINKARKTMETEAAARVRRSEDNFRVPCSVCGKPMVFSSRDENWESAAKPVLYSAFGNWHHTTCAQ